MEDLIEVLETMEELIEVFAEAKEIIHHSICGLEWAKDEYPEYFNEADGEHLMWLKELESKMEEQLEKVKGKNNE